MTRKCSSSKKWILWIHCPLLSCRQSNAYSCRTPIKHVLSICAEYARLMLISKTAFFGVCQKLLFSNQGSNLIFNI